METLAVRDNSVHIEPEFLGTQTGNKTNMVSTVTELTDEQGKMNSEQMSRDITI